MHSLKEQTPGAPAQVELPHYPGIRLEYVHLVQSRQAAEAALTALMGVDALGFDTESKPTFLKGEASTGPHLIQLAREDRAWLFPLTAQFDITLLKPLLESPRILKVGFGLKDDVKRLAAKFGIHMQGVVDLSVALRGIQRHDFGAKTAMAHFFGQKLHKSRKISTTNWSNPRYSPGQIRYAANDAQVPLLVYREWVSRGGKLKTARADPFGSVRSEPVEDQPALRTGGLSKGNGILP